MSWGSELWVSVREFPALVHLTVLGEPMDIADSTFAAKKGVLLRAAWRSLTARDVLNSSIVSPLNLIVLVVLYAHFA